MKKQNILILITILITFKGCTCYQESDLNRSDTSIPAAPQINATDGHKIGEILISWESISKAEYYNLYRSKRPDTRFCIIGTVKAEERGRLVEPNVEVLNPGGINQEDPDPADETEYLPAVFTSDININTKNILGYTGKYVAGSQNCKIDISAGESINFTVEFPGNTWGHYYNRDEVVDRINEAAGQTICEAHAEGFLKITAPQTDGPIIISNNNNPPSYNPVAYFLKSGTAQDEVITIEQEEKPDETGDGDETGQTDETDQTGNSRDELSPSGYYVCDKNVITGKTYYYKMKAFTSQNKLIAESIIDSGFATSTTAPQAPGNIKASKGEGQDVTISWDEVPNAIYYRVFRYKVERLDLKGMFSPIVEKVSETSFIDTAQNGLIPGMFLYRVSAFNEDDEQSMHSSEDYGFRILTNNEFIQEYDTVIESSFTKFTLLHKNGLGAIGTEKIYANVKINNQIGTGIYQSTGNISGADVTIDYHLYCDHYLTINGRLKTDIGYPAWNKNGTQTGKVTTSGIYNGYVEYHLDIKNGSAGGGYYTVCQDGHEPENLDWTVLDSN